MSKKKKNNPNPYVSHSVCSARYGKLDSKITEILHTLTGNPRDHEDLGLVGEVRDIKRDRRWILGLITLIGIPVFLFLIKYLFFGG